MGGWERNEIEHTFSSGRTMLIRRSVPLQWLVLRAVESDDPELAAGLAEWFESGTVSVAGDDPAQRRVQLLVASKVERAVIEAMFLRPRVWWDPEEMPPVEPTSNGDVPPHIAVADLTDAEMTEVLEMAFAGADEMARFREDTTGPGTGEGGEVLGDEPQPKPRSKSRKR